MFLVLKLWISEFCLKYSVFSATNSRSDNKYWDCTGSIFSLLKCSLQESLILIPIIILIARAIAGVELVTISGIRQAKIVQIVFQNNSAKSYYGCIPFQITSWWRFNTSESLPESNYTYKHVNLTLAFTAPKLNMQNKWPWVVPRRRLKE